MTIENLICYKTYGGFWEFDPNEIATLNDTLGKDAVDKLEKSYGDGRPIFTEFTEDYTEFYPEYTFIAWLDDENWEDETDEDGDKYHGKHLFVIGLTDSIENLQRDILKLGDERFEECSQGYFY